ncbi:short-chain dehydrogenase [Panus rudis PR-1116 ss-1]|nr:short-chain dehydrogenase [Panus rudis PR-1116 ss-1]
MSSNAKPNESLVVQKIYDLTGRIALVTGGGTGIGWMISRGLASNGAKVYITGRRKEVLEQAIASFKGAGSITPIAMDVTDRQSILSVKEEIESREGRLHILINNAGIVGPVSRFFNDTSAPEHKDAETLGRALFDNESFEAWSNVYNTNTFSIYFVTTAFLGLLAKGSEDRPGYTSSVVNITSISGLMKLAQNHACFHRILGFAYNSSKAAASHLTKMMSTEFALKKIPVRVNAIAPGVYESGMTSEEIKPDMVDKVSLGLRPQPEQRPGTAAEAAGTVIYLVSPAGCYTNGQEIVIDGGYLAINPSVV